MKSHSLQALALASLAAFASAQPLSTSDSTNITARAVPADEVIAQIVWFSGPGCDFSTSDSTLFYNVGTLSNSVFDPDQCDPGRPSYTNSDDGGNLATLPFNPASFYVSSTPQTCNPDVEDGQQLGSVILYPSCKRKIANPTDDPSNYCPGSCAREGWSRTADGYSTCINTPDYAAASGPLAFAIRQRISFC